MNRRLRKKLLVGIAIAALLAGVTAAVVMAAQPAGHRHSHGHRGSARGGALVSAAGYLGVSPAQLRSELRSGRSLAEIANATSGRSSAGLIEALEAAQREKLAAAAVNLTTRVTAEVDRVGERGGTLRTAARYLGVSAAQLRAERRSGQTLAQIARATSGRSQAGLIEALVAARKAALASEVAAGTITQAKSSEVLPDLVSRVTAQVNRAPRKHGSHLRAGGRGHRSHLSASALY
jgi:hypothetical protein